MTATRGPFIGVFFGLTYLFFEIKKNIRNISIITLIKPAILLIILYVFFLHIIPNPLASRISAFSFTNMFKPLESTNYSIRERVHLIKFSIEKINDSYLVGIGPQNIEAEVSKYIKNNKIRRITSRDHLHNEFIDITIKFGLLALVLLFFIYYFLLQSNNRENKVLLILLMIMLVSSQLTQSHFAHHQAITFFIALFYTINSQRFEKSP